MLTDLEVALAAVEAGTSVVQEGFRGARTPTFKGAVDPVTETDRLAEKAILGVLTRHRPDDAVLAEEGGGVPWDGPRVWIVDPLDGTVNFVHGIPHVAVSVALWDEGVPMVGVVADALRGEVFSAASEDGALLNGSPTRCSTISDPARSLLATGFPYDRQVHADAYSAVVAAVLKHFQGIRRLGSAALDICWVACGRYEGYWEYGLGAWDSAAAVLIAEAAGATVTTPGGGPYRLDSPGILVANPAIHGILAATVDSHRPPHLR